VGVSGAGWLRICLGIKENARSVGGYCKEAREDSGLQRFCENAEYEYREAAEGPKSGKKEEEGEWKRHSMRRYSQLCFLIITVSYTEHRVLGGGKSGEAGVAERGNKRRPRLADD